MNAKLELKSGHSGPGDKHKMCSNDLTVRPPFKNDCVLMMSVSSTSTLGKSNVNYVFMSIADSNTANQSMLPVHFGQ